MLQYLILMLGLPRSMSQGLHSYIVHSGTSSAVPGHEAARKVAMFCEPGLARGPKESLLIEPEEAFEAVFVSSRERVLGGEAVIDGNNKSVDVGGQAAEVVVDGKDGGAEMKEGTTMEVEQNGELGGGRGRQEEAEGGAKGGVKGDIFRGDVGRVGRGGASGHWRRIVGSPMDRPITVHRELVALEFYSRLLKSR